MQVMTPKYNLYFQTIFIYKHYLKGLEIFFVTYIHVHLDQYFVQNSNQSLHFSHVFVCIQTENM
jgi:hypothetical protein